MNELDIIKLISKSNINIRQDIDRAQKLIKENKPLKVAMKYKDIAKNCLSANLPQLAIHYYSLSSGIFIDENLPERAIYVEKSIFNIYKLMENIEGMASNYERIAFIHKFYLKNFNAAGWGYVHSSNMHLKNQNHYLAFEKARYAVECFELTSHKKRIIDANNLTFRTALLCGYDEKAGIHIRKSFLLHKKDYSPHYISLCLKGYISFYKAGLWEDSLPFLEEIIIAHYEKNKTQFRIAKYLKDYQEMYIAVNGRINEKINQYIIDETKNDANQTVFYSKQMKQYCDLKGFALLSDYYHIQENEFAKRKNYKEKNFTKGVLLSIWNISCKYGVSFQRWVGLSLSIVIVFGLIFSNIPVPEFYPDFLKQILCRINPEFHITSVNNIFTPFYYSIVTFTTLGYGDVTPLNLSAQIFSVIEVIIGYVMLGGLVSIFSKKVIK